MKAPRVSDADLIELAGDRVSTHLPQIQMAIELQERRADEAEGRARVVRVIREAVTQAFEAYDHGYNANRVEMVEHAEALAADQLARPALSAEQRASLSRQRQSLPAPECAIDCETCTQRRQDIATLDFLLGGRP